MPEDGFFDKVSCFRSIYQSQVLTANGFAKKDTPILFARRINGSTADWTLGALVQLSAAAALSCGFGSKNCGEEDEIVGTDTMKQPTSGSGAADKPVVTMAMMLFSLYNVLRWG